MAILLLLVIGAGFIYLGTNMGKSSKEKVSNLKINYDNALSGTSRASALEAGREYYRSLRQFGDLTIYDEQAISNDISVRKNLI